jgi:hypothetical protein
MTTYLARNAILGDKGGPTPSINPPKEFTTSPCEFVYLMQRSFMDLQLILYGQMSAYIQNNSCLSLFQKMIRIYMLDDVRKGTKKVKSTQILTFERAMLSGKLQ